MQYAIEMLKVKHIIVCGHYGCGGVRASLEEDQDHGLIDNWLRHIKDVHRFHATELDQIDDFEVKSNRLCELNVIEQVTNVCNSFIVQSAWQAGSQLSIHGWIYSIRNGVLNDLDVTYSSLEEFQARAITPNATP